MWLKLLFLAVFSCIASTATTENEEAIIDFNFEMANRIEQDMKLGKRKTLDRAKLAKMIRLLFHDCIGEGGCDGCLNIDSTNNKGLEGIHQELQDVYRDGFAFGKYKMSRADFHVLAGYTAMELASVKVIKRHQRRAKAISLIGDFRKGRQDCSMSPAEDDSAEDFPRNDFNNDELNAWFAKEFHFTPADTLAIMGVHTIGKVHDFEERNLPSKWVSNNPNLNNCMYKRMFWQYQQTYANHSELHWQQKSRPEVMLHADLAIAYKFKVKDNGQIDCRVGCPTKCDYNRKHRGCQDCCEKINEPQITKYRRKNNLWVTDFRKAVYKMTSIPDQQHQLSKSISMQKRESNMVYQNSLP